VVVLGPLRRRRNPIHMFASASRLQRGRSGAVTRIRTTATRTGTRTGTFHLERREGGHVCEGVPCRSLGLSLSSGRGLERTHAFDRSHRRTCCHQEYKRMILSLLCFNFFMLFGLLLYTLLHTRSTDYGTSAIGGRFSGARTPVQYYTSCIMYCGLRYRDHVMSSSLPPLYQTNHAMLTALAQDPSTRRVWTTKSHQ
jgi:hypothetical protein